MTASPEQTVNVKALSWTIGVHIALFLLFWLWHYTLPIAVAPPPQMGMEVNLGTSDNGSGTDQPMATADPAANQASVNYRSSSQSANVAKNMMQSNDVDAPTVNSVDTKNKNANNAVDNNKRRNNDQQQDNNDRTSHREARYVYAGGTGKGGNSAAQDLPGTSEGNTTGNGDRGVPGGTPGASNYTGSPGNGYGGISHTLSGRSISPDRFEASFHEGGTVVIDVVVDRNGTIVSKRIKSSPSAELSHLALQKLSQARFSASPDAQPQQFGKVTIVFKTRS